MALGSSRIITLTVAITVVFQLTHRLQLLGSEQSTVVDTGREIDVPEAIVRQLVASGAVDQDLFKSRNDGRKKGLTGFPLDLNRDKKPEIIVTGTPESGYCGATGNCSHWVFGEVAAREYRLLLDAGSVQKIDAQDTPSKGYRDVVTTRHDSAFDYTVRRFRFDGARYRLSECSEHHFDAVDDGRGSVRTAKRPVVTRVPC
jgi:hypothetical protein